MIRIGVIGYGYWGPNIVRNFQQVEGSRVVAVCDKSDKALRRVQQSNPELRVTSNVDELLTATDIDAIAVVTPVWTHFELAKKALANGKHVFVEKPFTSSTAQAEELIELAARKNLTIMVDHTFLFTGAVRKIRRLIDDGTLGQLYYYDSTRVNLGLFQHDVNVIWDLAPHDLSIMDYLIAEETGCDGGHRRRPPEWHGGRSLHHDLLSKQHHWAPECQLVIAGESTHNADRRREEDVGLE